MQNGTLHIKSECVKLLKLSNKCMDVMNQNQMWHHPPLLSRQSHSHPLSNTIQYIFFNEQEQITK